MPERDWLLFAKDILKCADKIAAYTRELTFGQFISDSKTYDAVLRNLELIGEAVKRLPREIRIKYSSVPWKEIAGLRDIVTHEYFGINNEIIWDVVTNEIPGLTQEIERILRDAEQNA